MIVLMRDAVGAIVIASTMAALVVAEWSLAKLEGVRCSQDR